MAELAYNINGDPFELPSNATQWKVMRMNPKGPPATVYRDGLPLRTPTGIDIDGLRNALGGVAGKYRLNPVDDQGKPVDAPAAYVQIDEADGDAPPIAAPVRDARDEVLVQLLRSQTDAMRSQVEMFARVVEANVEMSKAAAELIRAADGAGLPRRQPPPPAPEPVYVDVQDEDDEDSDPSPTTDWIGLINTIGQILPMLCDSDGLGALWSTVRKRGGGGGSRKPSPNAVVTPRAGSMHPAPAAPAPSGAVVSSTPTPADGELEQVADTHGDQAAELPPKAKNMLLHVSAIQQQLTPDEWKLCEAVIREMPSEERIVWRDQLLALSVDDAVALIRSAIEGSTS